jgi:hypothetical protein
LEPSGPELLFEGEREGTVRIKTRTRYTRWQKQQVMLHYPECRTPEDRQVLADRLGIVDDDGSPSIQKLYNLASRLGCTQGHDLSEREAIVTSEERLGEREDPETTVFSPSQLAYLKREFGRRTLESISFHLEHTETAVLYQARKLGLRKPAQHWNILKVARWLGFEIDEFRRLRAQGIDIYPLYDKSTPPRLELELVSTTSLWRWLRRPQTRRLLAGRNPDRFFLLELEETMRELVAAENEFERCAYLSHGHVCLNPRAGSYGMYCTNTDRQRAGEDPKCTVRTLEITDLSDPSKGEL